MTFSTVYGADGHLRLDLTEDEALRMAANLVHQVIDFPEHQHQELHGRGQIITVHIDRASRKPQRRKTT